MDFLVSFFHPFLFCRVNCWEYSHFNAIGIIDSFFECNYFLANILSLACSEIFTLDWWHLSSITENSHSFVFIDHIHSTSEEKTRNFSGPGNVINFEIGKMSGNRRHDNDGKDDWKKAIFIFHRFRLHSNVIFECIDFDSVISALKRKARWPEFVLQIESFVTVGNIGCAFFVVVWLLHRGPSSNSIISF